MNLCFSGSTNRLLDHIEQRGSVNSSLLGKIAIFVTVVKKNVEQSERTV